MSKSAADAGAGVQTQRPKSQQPPVQFGLVKTTPSAENTRSLKPRMVSQLSLYFSFCFKI